MKHQRSISIIINIYNLLERLIDSVTLLPHHIFLSQTHRWLVGLPFSRVHSLNPSALHEIENVLFNYVAQISSYCFGQGHLLQEVFNKEP